MDDEEAILEDKQQVLALQWTWKTQFSLHLFMNHNQEDQEVFEVLLKTPFTEEYSLKLSLKFLANTLIWLF